MRLEVRKLLEDMRQGIDAVSEFVEEKSEQDYLKDRQLRVAVERGFEIIGEALNQLKKIDPAMAESFTDWRAIISFRNVLIHGYSVIDNVKTWQIVQSDLTILRDEVRERLGPQAYESNTDLRANKLASGREKDLSDLKKLPNA